MVLERELFDDDAPCVDIIVVRRANNCVVVSAGMVCGPAVGRADAGEGESAAAWGCRRARC